MSASAALVLFFAGYGILLGGIALVAERSGWVARTRWASRAVYVLGLGAYCTSWTFYGSVGSAASGKWLFLTIYLGPTLGALFWPDLLGRLVAVRDRFKAVSVADLASARFGKSAGIGTLVTVASIVAVVPYIALQIRAVHDSGRLMLAGDQAGLGPSFDLAILAALILFSAGFGVRHLRSTEPNQGLVASIAFESGIKLIAFLAVGLYATFWLHDGPFDALDAARAATPEPAKDSFLAWTSLTLLSAWAFLFLPRQFHMAVVENRDRDFIRTATVWVPIFLLAMNLFVVPIAASGIGLGLPREQADAYVIGVPLARGQIALAWLVFAGGISAAVGMVTLSSVTVGTMACHHLVLPLLSLIDRRHLLSRRVLLLRRIAVAGVLLAGYGFGQALGNASTLVSIGILAFAAIAQLAPIVLAALYWPGASRVGAFSGLALGFGCWLYTLFLPALADVQALPGGWLEHGPLGFEFLRPRALFGLEGLDPVSHALVWSIGFNVLGLVIGSALAPATASERKDAERFADPVADAPDSLEVITPDSDIDLEPKIVDLVQATTRWLDEATSQRILDDILARHALDIARPVSIVQLRELKVAYESELAAVIGVALAHRTVGGSGFFGDPERERLAAHYARVMTELDISPRELRHQVERYRAAQIEALEQADLLERVVADRTAELETANAELVEAKQVAEQASSAKSEFLCSVSHEIRTPLTAILGSVQLALDGELEGQPLVGHLKTVESNGEHLLSLLNDILDLSKVESGKLDVERIPTCPRSIAEEVQEILRGRAEARGIRIDLSVDPQTPSYIVSDPTRLRQILLNLVGNAIKFTSEGGVSIAVDTLAERVLRIAVTDSGIGMTEAQLRELFQPFVQAHSSTTRLYGGTGLGLAISRKLAERLGGELDVASQEGEGSTFTLTLRDVELADAPLPAGAGAGRPLLGGGTGRLLLVEDNPVNQRIASAMLRRAGHEVEIAEDGAKGLEAALAAWRTGQAFDVVLMDMSMPVMDGYEAVTRLREAGYPGPIVALTAHAMELERRRCLELGCDDFSTKPYRPAELFAIIGRLLGRSEMPRSA